MDRKNATHAKNVETWAKDNGARAKDDGARAKDDGAREKDDEILLNMTGVQFPAPKLVLSRCSTYFRALFTRWSSPDFHVFEISNVSADIMKIILDYCYTGEVHITQENCQELLIAADYLDVSDITQACCQFMENQLCPSNCITIWEKWNKYYYPQLKNLVFLYILKHFEEVLTSSEDFLQISGEDLCSVIDEDRLNVKEETTVLNAVLRWVAHAPEERNLYLANLLAKVRVGLIHPKYFAQCMIKYNLLYNCNCKDVAINTIRVILAARAQRSYAALPLTRLDTPRLPSAVLMAIGGRDKRTSNATNKIEVYDNRTNCWMGVAHDDWKPRAFHGTVFLNGSVYVIGGYDGYEHLKTTHKYDLANHTWRELAPMHSRRSCISVALLDGLIYVMGGDNREESLDTVERYSPETNQWTMISPMNKVRSNANSTAYNGKIYICGGYDGVQRLASAETYDPLTDQWTMIADMANRRFGLGVIAYANEIYAIGGCRGMNTVEAYNPTTNTWRPLPNMQTGREGFGIGVVDDRLYVVGGQSGFNIINLVECFDVSTGVWTRVQDMEISRADLSCCVVSDLPNMADYAPPRPAPSHDDPAEEETCTHLNKSIY